VKSGTTTTYTLTSVTDEGNGCALTGLSSAVTVTVMALPPSAVYVDDDYAGLNPGTPVTWPYVGGTGSHIIGCDAFATIGTVNAIPGGVDAVASGGTVHVAAGRYAENVVVARA